MIYIWVKQNYRPTRPPRYQICLRAPSPSVTPLLSNHLNGFWLTMFLNFFLFDLRAMISGTSRWGRSLEPSRESWRFYAEPGGGRKKLKLGPASPPNPKTFSLPPWQSAQAATVVSGTVVSGGHAYFLSWLRKSGGGCSGPSCTPLNQMQCF